MRRHSAAIVGAALAGLAILALFMQRAENVQLRAEIQSLTEERARLSGAATDRKAHAEPHASESPRREQDADSSYELLRLRGEVARLRLDLQEAQKLGPEPKQTLVPDRLSYPDEVWAALGVDTNSVPRIHSLCTTDDGLAELHRVGAEILADEQQTDATRYIRASFHPATIRTAEENIASVGVQLWFKDGRLDGWTERWQ